MDDSHILAVDQGTSGTKAVVFDTQGQIRAQAAEPLSSYFPQPGFVEQEPEEIYRMSWLQYGPVLLSIVNLCPLI